MTRLIASIVLAVAMVGAMLEVSHGGGKKDSTKDSKKDGKKDKKPVDVNKQTLDDLQGEWRMVGGSNHGKFVDPEIIKETRYIFKDNQVTAFVPGAKVVRTVRINATVKPATIDLDAEGDDFDARGIFKLEKDRLTIVFSDKGRPTSFSPTAAQFIQVLERAKK